jgi:hypothetical protein
MIKKKRAETDLNIMWLTAFPPSHLSPSQRPSHPLTLSEALLSQRTLSEALRLWEGTLGAEHARPFFDVPLGITLVDAAEQLTNPAVFFLWKNWLNIYKIEKNKKI